MFQTLLAEIHNALERESVPYMVIGGQAVLVHGEPRVTKDIDITLGVDVDQLPEIKRIAERLFLQSLEGFSDEQIRRSAVFPAVHEASGIRVDFIFSFTPYETQAIKRAISVKIGSAYVRVATAEDTIIHKLFAGRPRDLEDVKGIISRNKTYDKDYLKNWLSLFSSVAEKDLWKEFVTIEKALWHK